MKTMKSIIVMFFAMIISTGLFAQATKTRTDTFKVWGNCDMCKNRIEKAVKEEGATSASWDVKTKILTLTYDPSKKDLAAFEKKVASVGHDTEKFRADDKVYSALPACCQYERAGANASSGQANHSKMDHSKMDHSGKKM